MRGTNDRSPELVSYVDFDARVPMVHPLRAMRDLMNPPIVTLHDMFAALYKDNGRPLIAPERLLRAILSQLFYSIHSERQLMERLNFGFLSRWFVGRRVNDPVWDPSKLKTNRTQVLTDEIAQGFLQRFRKRLRLACRRSSFTIRPSSSTTQIVASSKDISSPAKNIMPACFRCLWRINIDHVLKSRQEQPPYRDPAKSPITPCDLKSAD